MRQSNTRMGLGCVELSVPRAWPACVPRGSNYTLQVDGTNMAGQKDWKRCGKCQALFFSVGPASRCPAGPGLAHDGGASRTYALLNNVPSPAGHQAGVLATLVPLTSSPTQTRTISWR